MVERSEPHEITTPAVSILDADQLWRRIPPWHWITDRTGETRMSSAAFDNDDGADRFSVDVAKLRNSAAETLEEYSGFGLASFEVALAKTLGQKVEHSPIRGHPTLPDNPAHADVIGPKAKSIMKKLREGSRVLISPQPSI